MTAQPSAVGFGGYFEYLHGEGEVDFPGLDDFDFDTDKFGVGFVLDTNLAKNRLFNDRMTLGYQRSNRDIDIVDISVDGGPFLGLNLHVSKNLTIGLATSYPYLYIEETVSVDDDRSDQTEDFNGHEHLVSLNITFFLRTSCNPLR